MKQTGVNNLSQQLCELCGIEPKILYKSKSNLSSGTCWKTREEYKNSACNQSWSETENTRYPDFEKPENFVKLLEIYHQNDCYIDTYNFIAEGVHSFVEAFLRCIVDILSRDMDDLEIIEDFGRETIIKLKQAIAAEEWEY